MGQTRTLTSNYVLFAEPSGDEGRENEAKTRGDERETHLINLYLIVT